ncbi:MAG: aspartate/glutamate racemase family protein [Crocinitomicaceae bacterium]
MLNATAINSTIGILGGIGPWAGLDVHQKILKLSDHSIEQECVSILHHSYPRDYSDRTEFLLGETHVNPANAFAKALQSMERQGADIAAIVCNTAHAGPIIGEIRAQLKSSALIYVDIIEETQNRLNEHNVSRVGLLATLGTYRFGLYENNFSGELILPNEIDQNRVHDCIYDKAFGLKVHYPKVDDFIYSELKEVGGKLVAQGAEALVLGCTELPLINDLREHFNVPVYDPNQILAEAMLREAKVISELKKQSQIIHNIS